MLNKKKKVNSNQKLYIDESFTKKQKFTHSRKFKIFKENVEFKNFMPKIEKDYTKYYFLVGFVLIILTFFVFLFSDYFAIKEFMFVEKKGYIDVGLANKSLTKQKYTPLIFANKIDVFKAIKEYQNQVLNIRVDKVYPNILKVVYESSPSVFGLDIRGNKFELTQNGIIVPEMKETKLKKILIKDKLLSDIEILSYKNYLSENEVKNIIKITEDFNKLYKTSDAIIFKQEKEIHLLKDGTRFIFDYQLPSDEQLKKLIVFNKTELPKIGDQMIYIDLRIPDKLFYCPNKEKNKCLQNISSIYPE